MVDKSVEMVTTEKPKENILDVEGTDDAVGMEEQKGCRFKENFLLKTER